MSKQKKAADTAIAHRPAAEVTTSDDFSSLGNTQIGANDIQMPRLKLLQALSQAVSNDEAPAGVFFNSLTGENYGPAVSVVPVIGFKNRVYMEQGKGLLCRSLDMIHGIGDPGIACADCTLKDWPADRGAGGPKCRESRNWVGLLTAAIGDKPVKKGQELPELTPLDEPAFIVIQFMSMASMAARKLNGLYLNSKITNPNAQWFDYVFKLTSTQTKNDKGTFYVPDVRPAGKTTPALKDSAKSLMAFMAGRTLAVDADEDDVRAETAADMPAGSPSF